MIYVRDGATPKSDLYIVLNFDVPKGLSPVQNHSRVLKIFLIPF
ncbi:MAG: hypothetical protein ACTSPD_07620 [Promethearchaeota archaeon]